jgi:hypothetical protein
LVNGIVLTDGVHTVNLTNQANYEMGFPVHIAEISIPGREGGQVQYLGSPQHTVTITGILNQLAGGTDDVASFESGGNLDLIKKNTAADCTLTITYNATVVYSHAGRIGYKWWPIKGSTSPWFAYQIDFKEKG